MPDQQSSRNDLSRLHLLELNAGIAGAFAAALMSDFGADTIVCEGPPAGAPMRQLGPAAVHDVWWGTIARNKRSLAVDPSHPGAAVIMQRLRDWASIVVDAEAGEVPPSGGTGLRLHIHPTGADNPEEWGWSVAPELAGAATGMMAVTGQAKGPPVQPEFPIADYTAGILGAASALFELRASALEKRPPVPLSFGTHEMMLRMNEWQLVIAAAIGQPEVRVGNRLPMNTNVGSIFETRDDKLLTVSAATQQVIERLIAMVGGEEAARDPRFRTLADRKIHMDALEEIIARWMRQHDAEDAMSQVQHHDVVAGPIFNAADMEASEQMKARADIITVKDSSGNALGMPAVLPNIDGVAHGVKRAGPTLGVDTDAILGELGFGADEIAAFRRTGAVWK